MIRQNLESEVDSKNNTTNYITDFSGIVLTEFQNISVEDVKKMINSSPSKSCTLDPIPTWLLKQCLDEIAPALTLIVNASLAFADFSPELKKAFVTPLIKKAILDCEILKNFRPVSNLSYLSKLIERIVCVQLVDHLKQNNLYELFQSAYRALHSTETALLRVHNDLLQAVDSHGGAILVLLDLSAAFDTIDHVKLINILDRSFGVRGTALEWFKSYLQDRTQRVQIGNEFSDAQTLKFGVPQGSVLGPILFTIYTTPLGNLIRKHGLSLHLYADDTQLYLAFKPTDSMSKEDAIKRIEECVVDIKLWMTNNLLKLNDDKTELIIVTSRESLSKSLGINIKVGDQLITPSETPPKNLGVLFDSTCSLKYHVARICKSLNYQLYSIGKIRKYLDLSAAKMLMNAIISSRLDYCNSLLYGINKAQLEQLQRCQNQAARIVSLRKKYDHITPVLKDLHWLPVKARIDFKIMLLTYKALNGIAPLYISELLEPYTPSRALRSSDKQLLCVPKWRLEGFGGRSFARFAPSLWNELPMSIRSAPSVETFKSRLKTHIFTAIYT